MVHIEQIWVGAIQYGTVVYVTYYAQAQNKSLRSISHTYIGMYAGSLSHGHIHMYMYENMKYVVQARWRTHGHVPRDASFNVRVWLGFIRPIRFDHLMTRLLVGSIPTLAYVFIRCEPENT